MLIAYVFSVLVRRNVCHAVCHLLQVMRLHGKINDGRIASTRKVTLDSTEVQEEIQVESELAPKNASPTE